VLSTVIEDVSLVGHHQNKLDLAQWNGITTSTTPDVSTGKADIVVDATGTTN